MGLEFTGKNLRLYSADLNKDGSKQYHIRYKNKDGKRVTKRAPNDVEPLGWAKQLDEVLEQSKTLSIEERAMDEMMERYKDLMRSHVENYRNNAKHGKQLAESIFDKNRSYIDQHIIPYFGPDNIAHVTPKTILKW